MNEINKQYWYVVCESKKLRKHPIAITLLEKPIVLFRSKKEIIAMLDKCPHRNAPLSCGKVRDGNIQCPYHGWVFNGDGKCVEIPGMEEFKEKPFYDIEKYQTHEEGGLVWVNLESKDSSPYLPKYFYNKKFISFTFSSKSKVSLANAIENFLDGTHTNYVHSGLIRKENVRQKVTAEVRSINNGVEISYVGEEKQTGIISKWFEGKRVKSIARFTMPNIAELEYHDNKGLKAAFFVHFLPEGENVTNAIVSVSIRKMKYLNFLIKPILFPFLWLALIQDRKILELQQSNIKKFGGKESFINTKLDIIRPYLKLLLSGQKLGVIKNKTVNLYL